MPAAKHPYHRAIGAALHPQAPRELRIVAMRILQRHLSDAGTIRGCAKTLGAEERTVRNWIRMLRDAGEISKDES